MVRQVFEGTELRILGRSIGRSKLLVTFDNWREERPGFAKYTPTKWALHNGFGHVSVQTAQNDWYLNGDTEALRAALGAQCQGREVYVIGFSMGGYGMLLFADALCATRTLLCSPQYSIFPASAPYETRYLVEAGTLDPAQDRLPAMDANPLAGTIIYDPVLQRADRMHADHIRRLHPGLAPVAFPFGGHPPLNNLKHASGFSLIQKALLTDQLTAPYLRGLHRKYGRKSMRYSANLGRYLARRQAR